MKYILYNKADGTIIGHGSTPAKDLSGVMTKEIGALEVDEVPNESTKVSNGSIVPKSTSEVESAEIKEAAKDLRNKRNAALRNHVDAMNPVRWDSMPENERQAWRDYRQALLDLPQNTADPRNVEWPEAPE